MLFCWNKLQTDLCLVFSNFMKNWILQNLKYTKILYFMNGILCKIIMICSLSALFDWWTAVVANCGEPMKIERATIDQGSTLEGSVRTYTCDMKTVTEGETKIACLESGVWSDTSLYCRRKKLNLFLLNWNIQVHWYWQRLSLDFSREMSQSR